MSEEASGAGPVPTHCPYCALQCGISLEGSPEAPVLKARPFPVNRGLLCVKGFTAGATLAHPERLTTPLVRNARGALAPAEWDQALDLVAVRLQEAQARHGRDAAAVFGSGSLTNEKAYLLGKFARVALRTRSIDYNGRFCMASAAAAANLALGLDRGLPFPLEDLARTELLLLVGGNPAETMPPLLQWLDEQRAAGGQLVVVDPRRTETARAATLHLRLIPGTDAALANGLLHLLVREGLLDRAYIEERTEGFERALAVAAAWWPERVERITGVPEAQLVRAAHMLGRARSAILLTARGAEQHVQGVRNTLAFINLALATGRVGRPASGYGTLTGQGNGQGGREHGQKADQLPGYRRIDDPAARRHIAAVWDLPEADLPGPGPTAFPLLDSLGAPGGVRALWVVGSNPAVSAPDALRIDQRLRDVDFLAVSDFFLSETAALADVVLPSSQWAEEEGTTTNLEGRVILRRRAFAPPPGVRSDVDVICAMAAKLGEARRFSFSCPREVFDELRRASQGGAADYSGISWERLAAEGGIFWPCPAEDHPGTPRLFLESFPTPSGRARFHAAPHEAPAEAASADYPLLLTTGRVLAQYQSGTQTRRVPELARAAPEPMVQMHPRTARRFAVADRSPVTLATRRGRARFRAEVTPLVREDTLFVPFHWGGESCANRLTDPALDPLSGMPEFKVCAARIEPAEGIAP